MEPIKWKSMSTNINDDGTGKTTQVIATEEDGTVYRLRKTGDEMVFLSVDGHEIAKEKYPQYYSAIDAIEQAGKRRTADALKAQEVQAIALRQQQQALQQKLEELQQQRMKLDQQRQAVRFDSLRRLSYLNRYEPRKEGLYTPYKPTPATTNATLTAIIADLVSAKLVDSETKLSFSLNAAEMVINGKVAAKELAEKFRKKYLKNPGDSFRYFKDGGTTRTEISLE